MPVSVTSKATTLRRLPEHGMVGHSSLRRPLAHLELHTALLREFEGVREQVLQDLLQPLRIGDDAAPEIRVEISTSKQSLASPPRDGTDGRPSRPALVKKISSASTETVPDSIFDRSRMSLIRLRRSVPAPWMVRANSTCLRREVAVGILGKLLAENQDAVQRRAQLMRHVGEELRLVFRSQRELGRLLLERAPRLLDLLVLALDLDVLLGELLRLLLELLVGLLQLGLLRSAARRRAAATASAGPRSASSPRCC